MKTLSDLSPPDTSSQWRSRITSNPEQLGGKPCIRGMRIRVVDVLDLLIEGLTPQQVVQELPVLELKDVEAALRFTRDRIESSRTAAA